MLRKSQKDISPQSPKSSSFQMPYGLVNEADRKSLESIPITPTKQSSNKNIPLNRPAKRRTIQNYKILLQKNFNQGNRMKQSSYTINDKKVPSSSTSLVLEGKQNNENFSQGILKQNKVFLSGFQFTFTQNFQKSQMSVGQSSDEILQDSDFFNKTVIADSFTGSFRAVLSLYVELYYQKLTLAQYIKKRYAESFEYLLQLVDYQFFGDQIQVQIDQLSLAIFRLIRNQEFPYKISDIKAGLKKLLPCKSHVSAKQFASIFQTYEGHEQLTNSSKNMMHQSFKQLIRTFFETFAQFCDTEIKLKKICKANQKRLMKLIVELSLNEDLNLHMMTEFLYFDIRKGKKWLSLRFEQFFKRQIGRKDYSISFLKWLKQNL